METHFTAASDPPPVIELVPAVAVESVLPSALGVAAVVVGAVLAYYGLRFLRRGVAIWRNDPVSVVEATNADGVVELEGTVEADEEFLNAPFTGTDCVAVDYEIEEYRSSGKSSSWRTLHRNEGAVPFRVADDTGRILVDPAGADLSLTDGAEVEVDRGETAGGRIAQFLATTDVDPGEGGEFGIGPLSVSTGDRRRYTERRLDVGERVHVYGPVERDLTAAEAAGDVNAAVRAEAGDGFFVVSDTAERSTALRSLGKGAVLLLVGGLAGAVTAWWAVGVGF